MAAHHTQGGVSDLHSLVRLEPAEPTSYRGQLACSSTMPCAARAQGDKATRMEPTGQKGPAFAAFRHGGPCNRMGAQSELERLSESEESRKARARESTPGPCRLGCPSPFPTRRSAVLCKFQSQPGGCPARPRSRILLHVALFLALARLGKQRRSRPKIRCVARSLRLHFLPLESFMEQWLLGMLGSGIPYISQSLQLAGRLYRQALPGRPEST